jgi:hypothetical protein
MGSSGSWRTKKIRFVSRGSLKYELLYDRRWSHWMRDLLLPSDSSCCACRVSGFHLNIWMIINVKEGGCLARLNALRSFRQSDRGPPIANGTSPWQAEAPGLLGLKSSPPSRTPAWSDSVLVLGDSPGASPPGYA